MSEQHQQLNPDRRDYNGLRAGDIVSATQYNQDRRIVEVSRLSLDRTNVMLRRLDGLEYPEMAGACKLICKVEDRQAGDTLADYQVDGSDILKNVEADAPDLVIDILEQGAPQISHGAVVLAQPNLVALTISLSSKRCDVLARGEDEAGVPNITLEATKASVNLHPEQARDALTEFALPQYAGWQIWAAESGKASVQLCLLRPEAIQI